MAMETQYNSLDDVDEHSTIANLLMVLKTEEADILDKVLLEMVIEDVKAFVKEGEAREQFEAVWATLEEWKVPDFVTTALAQLPKQVMDAEKVPDYHYKFALNLLSILASHENIFVQLQSHRNEVLTSVVRSCEVLDVDAVLCLPLATAVTECMQHSTGSRWTQQTGVWGQLVTVYAASGGGRFRPALSRLLIGRLARLWAGPTSDLTAPLEAVRRFLVVPARRLKQDSEHRPPWLACVELLWRLVQQLLRERHQSPPADQHRHVIGALAEQVAVPMELAPSPLIPAQLYVCLHLLDQSASAAAVTSAAQRACRALCRQAGKGALRDVTALLLDTCILGQGRCCHLAAMAAAPVWSVLQRGRAPEMTPEETACAEKHRALVQEFVAGDPRLAAVLCGTEDRLDPDEPALSPDRLISLVKSVFLSRADRPCPSPDQTAPDLVMVHRLVQPWVLLLKHSLVQQARTQVDVLTLMANLCGPADVMMLRDGVTSLLGLEDVIVNILQQDQPDRTAVCALQCLSRCAPLLPPPSGPVWARLAALLTTRLSQPTGEDALDAAGEAVLALVRADTQRPANQHAVRTSETNESVAPEQATNESAALLSPTNQDAVPTQPTNESAAPTPPTNQSVLRTSATNESAARPLADWLATNRLPSAALSALLGAGPGGRRAADWLLEAAAGEVWSEMEQHTDLMELLDSCVDGDLVVGTAALEFLRRRLSRSHSSLPLAAEWEVVLPFLQTALCSGDSAVSRSSQAVLSTVVRNDLSAGSPIAGRTAAGWLQDGAALALLRLATDPAHRDSGPDSQRDPQRELLLRVASLLSGDRPTSAGDVMEPGALDTVRRLCGGSRGPDPADRAESRDSGAALDAGSRDSGAAPDAGSRDSGAAPDAGSRDSIISCVLAESTEEFFRGRAGGGRAGGVNRLRRRPEVSLSLRRFLDAASAAERPRAPPQVAPSATDEEVVEALVRRVAARVQEIFRCATMDRQTEITIDCY